MLLTDGSEKDKRWARAPVPPGCPWRAGVGGLGVPRWVRGNQQAFSSWEVIFVTKARLVADPEALTGPGLDHS